MPEMKRFTLTLISGAPLAEIEILATQMVRSDSGQGWIDFFIGNDMVATVPVHQVVSVDSNYIKPDREIDDA